MSSTLRIQTINAAAWVTGGRAASQVISFSMGIILARLLSPDDFGLIAMAAFFTGIAGLLSDVGFGSALIQKSQVSNVHYSTVFWFNLVVGILLALVFFLSANPIANFYKRPELTNIVEILSFSFILSSLALVPRNRMAKSLQFREISIADFAGTLTGGLTAIFLALNGFGYLSLVVQILVNRSFSLAVIWLTGRWLPSCTFRWSALRGLLSFSSSVFGTQLVSYFGKQADKLFIGRFIGGNALGVYERAYSIMLFPLRNISHVIGSVMFPSLSTIQNDKDRVRRIYLRCTAAIAVITFPMMAGIFVVAEHFVLGVLGPQWSELVPILRVFAICGFFTSIVTVTGSIYLSQGAASRQLLVNLVTKPITVIAIVVGLNWGTLGVATSFTVATAINSLITLSAAGRLIGLGMAELAKELAPALLPTLLMLILLWLVNPLLTDFSHLAALSIQMSVGAMLYIACAHALGTPAYLDLLKTIKSR